MYNELYTLYVRGYLWNVILICQLSSHRRFVFENSFWKSVCTLFCFIFVSLSKLNSVYFQIFKMECQLKKNIIFDTSLFLHFIKPLRPQTKRDVSSLYWRNAIAERTTRDCCAKIKNWKFWPQFCMQFKIDEES